MQLRAWPYARNKVDAGGDRNVGHSLLPSAPCFSLMGTIPSLIGNPYHSALSECRLAKMVDRCDQNYLRQNRQYSFPRQCINRFSETQRTAWPRAR
jgi:hypothetical protein